MVERERLMPALSPMVARVGWYVWIGMMDVCDLCLVASIDKGAQGTEVPR